MIQHNFLFRMAKRMALAFSDTNGEKTSSEPQATHEGSATASPGPDAIDISNTLQQSLQHQIHPSQSRFLYNHNSHHTLYWNHVDDAFADFYQLCIFLSIKHESHYILKQNVKQGFSFKTNRSNLFWFSPCVTYFLSNWCLRAMNGVESPLPKNKMKDRVSLYLFSMLKGTV